MRIGNLLNGVVACRAWLNYQTLTAFRSRNIVVVATFLQVDLRFGHRVPPGVTIFFHLILLGRMSGNVPVDLVTVKAK